MDTNLSKNAAKKCCQCENCAAANLPTPATIADANPPAIITQNASDTTTTITDSLKCSDKEIETFGGWQPDELQKKHGRMNMLENR